MKNLFVLAVALGLMACAPKVYVIDHHTVFEEEASGQWPDVDQKYLGLKKKRDATLLEKNENSQKREKLTSILYGELDQMPATK